MQGKVRIVEYLCEKAWNKVESEKIMWIWIHFYCIHLRRRLVTYFFGNVTEEGEKTHLKSHCHIEMGHSGYAPFQMWRRSLWRWNGLQRKQEKWRTSRVPVGLPMLGQEGAAVAPTD
jgi:hypothetical protein